jgi:predicted nucleic acid-binding Zn ribbon protein
MPLYTFECKCGSIFYEIVNYDQNIMKCECGLEATRKLEFTKSQAMFNCDGFYCVDNKGKI